MRHENVNRAKAAFADIVRDLAQLEHLPRGVRVEFVEGDDEYREYVRIAWTQGSRSVELPFYFGDPEQGDTDDEDDAQLLVRLADDVQEQVSYGPGDPVWPVCISHFFGLHPEVRDGVAVWVCRPHKHVVSAIGKLLSVVAPLPLGATYVALPYGAANDRAPQVDGYAARSSGSGQRVIGLGAICDYRSGGEVSDESVSFWVSEFVVLDDGQRVFLHQERGFTSSYTIGGEDIPRFDDSTRESIEESVLMTVLPGDDYEGGPNHDWEWLAQLARAKGIEVAADDLSRVPYEVVVTDRVERWLASATSGPYEGK